MINDALDHLLNNAGQFSDQYISELQKLLHDEIYTSRQIIHAAGQVELTLYLIEQNKKIAALEEWKKQQESKQH